MSAPDRRIDCAGTVGVPGLASTAPMRIDLAGGAIAAMTAERDHAPSSSRLVAMPVLVNAHDHARPVRASSFGAGGKPLEIWLHHLALLPHVDPHLAACVSLGRSALGGAGAVMVHHTRFRSFEAVPQEAAAIGRAARDIGLRIGFAPALRDINPLVYGPAEPVLAGMPDTARAAIARRIASPAPTVADLILLDLDRLDADALLPRSDPLGLLLARGVKADIAEMIVAGRTILAAGRLTGIDHPAAERELLARFRHAMAGSADLAAALPHLEAALASHFEPESCC